MSKDNHPLNDEHIKRTKGNKESNRIHVSATVTNSGQSSFHLYAAASIGSKVRPGIEETPKSSETRPSSKPDTKTPLGLHTPPAELTTTSPEPVVKLTTPASPTPVNEKKTEERKHSDVSNHTDSHSSKQLPPSDGQSESLDSTRSVGLVKTPKPKLSRIIIAQNSVNSRSDHSEAEKSSLLRRPSLGWNQRVSVNTPLRRISEHEVTWVDSKDVDMSSSDSSDSEEDREPNTRPSIVVNMDTDGGRKISFALDKLDVEILDYLAELPEENSDTLHSVKHSDHD